jgi:hypothetical protein
MSAITFAAGKIATEQEAKTFLLALAASPFAFHLDDDALEVPSIPSESAAVLNDRVAECRAVMTEDALWSFYFDACETHAAGAKA